MPNDNNDNDNIPPTRKRPYLDTTQPVTIPHFHHLVADLTGDLARSYISTSTCKALAAFDPAEEFIHVEYDKHESDRAMLWRVDAWRASNAKYEQSKLWQTRRNIEHLKRKGKVDEICDALEKLTGMERELLQPKAEKIWLDHNTEKASQLGVDLDDFEGYTELPVIAGNTSELGLQIESVPLEVIPTVTTEPDDKSDDDVSDNDMPSTLISDDTDEEVLLAKEDEARNS